MQQIEIFPIPSPCIGICQVNEKGLCRGCFRNRDERFYWQKLTPSQQRNVIRLAHNRKLRYLRAKAQATQSSIQPHEQSLDLPFDESSS
ncbi:DUF1289 domain-containing protein [Celerinatantimonas diazotrophica]|jgi:uncharacterized protein|uniref:Fe-S protein YdhL (DUF1289 family) n=1 Tax=Celerinatantimonas diazotrophica TaxID=412034 RepID=A0A4R1K449_9GAMM|nr:DUF1289 domain-containing protein [Celerinatantimonas diazotrophica]TCK58896.1 hypothetical protein EV690_1051 [Celerinatantimonas diazotrophica]CAG9297528.1 hypothetical protein CEDIAZO_02715 [Celerinatantimonas diazotrophica]